QAGLMFLDALALCSLRSSHFFFLPRRRPPSSPLFPYTTLFRSITPLDRRAAPQISDEPAHQERPAVVLVRDPADGREQVPHVCRSEEHTSELQSRSDLVCRLLLEKKKNASSASPAATSRTRRYR